MEQATNSIERKKTEQAANSIVFLAFVLLFFASPGVADPLTYNVLNYGAKPDDNFDSTQALVAAWTLACGSINPATIYVPPGRFLVRNVVFRGQCKNNGIVFRIDGTLVAPSDYKVIGSTGNWLFFEHVNGVSIYGGILDGQGTGLWTCKRSGKGCPSGATSLGFSNSRSIETRGLTSLNSQMYHIVINECQPLDCVSVGPGTNNLWIEKVACGPGHGISIGSLGKEVEEAGVQNVTVKTVAFTGTENGVRIKSWGRQSSGFARNILFQHAVMTDVQNPIVIDQHYCPDEKSCPDQVSGVKISDVTYQDIHGTSATEVAVKFDCSSEYPCSNIRLEDVKLTYRNKAAEASCSNADGTASGFVQPSSCL
ncbi:hypothetical protein ES332_A09G197600v1 [Gossypium tomentosum]|uniref:Pectate lyase superfamily protein domain-containing protein n=1 Tax=Gossypium tomentosum TaxID=34277 RepID=A0A5D2P662_GOSTO|nr:hypothetical protein ES332_A09G197600v1 [Gossypium tomentosum]